MSDYEIRDPRFNKLIIGHAKLSGSEPAVAGQTSLYAITSTPTRQLERRLPKRSTARQVRQSARTSAPSWLQRV